MRRKLSYDMPINEEKVMQTIAVSKAAFLSGEAEQRVSPGEFLIMQSRLIQKRWWFLQGMLLACVCLIICLHVAQEQAYAGGFYKGCCLPAYACSCATWRQII